MALRLPRSAGERRRAVSVNLTFEKMAAMASPASSSTQRMRGSSSLGRGTTAFGCGMCARARRSRSSRATGDRYQILRNVASSARSAIEVTVLPTPFPSSAGERRRAVPVRLTFEKMAALSSAASSSTRRMRGSSSLGLRTTPSNCGDGQCQQTLRGHRAVPKP